MPVESVGIRHALVSQRSVCLHIDIEACTRLVPFGSNR
jgi:hypothetical protein